MTDAADTSPIYPIAETFWSIQGEGPNTGMPMYFIRLAGCNVGRHVVPAAQQPLVTDPHDLQVLQASHPAHTACTGFSGERFLCDTDYGVKERLSLDDLMDRVLQARVNWVSITGGEPYIHDLMPLLARLGDEDIAVNIETSGTCIVYRSPYCECLVVCSPKHDFLTRNVREIDVYKFVVGPDTTLAAIETFIRKHAVPSHREVYLLPLNDVHTCRRDSLDNALNMLHCHPEWVLSPQVHKYLEMR